MQPLENPKPPFNNSEREKYEALLIKQIESIPSWNELSEERRVWAAEDFMDAIGRLFLDYYQFHLDEAKTFAIKYKSTLMRAVDPILSYMIDLHRELRGADAMEDPWEEACIGRTNIEAFNLMFSEQTEFLDPIRFDEYMQDRKGTVYLENELIPKNAPLSHWWWFEDYFK